MTSRNTPWDRTITDGVSLWIKPLQRPQRWIVEAYSRASGGVLHIEKTYQGQPPVFDTVLKDLRTHGSFSPRPVLIGQPYDPSMTYCLLAIFSNCCRSRGLDPLVLIERSNPDARHVELDFALITAQAEWEGTAYPAQWDEHNTTALVAWLRRSGSTALATELSRALRRH